MILTKVNFLFCSFLNRLYPSPSRFSILISIKWPRPECLFHGERSLVFEASDNRTEEGCGRVTTGSALAVSTPKFKRRSVSAVRDFPPRYGRATTSNYGLTILAVRDFLPGCGRVTASNYGLTRQIAIDHSDEGK
ncbi:hypothetical protein J1N35_029039 [Gossypium stocksii]|uniref:Uncharacterized protein n=1 Tax=Gossypium stocksii TaxID=47602 RepID=A0A9D3UX47_9ROSI|nr:hypothetical protein J1N35_029039 [Gossypium stocksii]